MVVAAFPVEQASGRRRLVLSELVFWERESGPPWLRVAPAK
jgi:hypothetical protein